MSHDGPRQVLESGILIGDFRIEQRLGAGGMGIVYLARQMSLNRLVALKVLGSALNRASDIERFRREAQAAAMLKHPGIATVYFVGQDAQVCFLAMEFIDGVPLRRIIDFLATNSQPDTDLDRAVERLTCGDSQPTAMRFDDPTVAFVASADGTGNDNDDGLSHEARQLLGTQNHLQRCCTLVREAALALAHAHEHGVIHRDLKPDNLLVDKKGAIHIIDFGLARFFEDVTVTHTGQVVGTPMYMSPEQVTGRTEVDHRSDIYSLGLVLFEMLTLRRPIQATSRERVFHYIVTRSLPRLRSKNPAVSVRLESVVHKATARNPDERYQTFAAFAADLGRLLANESVEALPYRYPDIAREVEDARPAHFYPIIMGIVTMWLLGGMGGTACLASARNQGYVSLAYAQNSISALAPLLVGICPVTFGIFSVRAWALWLARPLALVAIVVGASLCAPLVIALGPKALLYGWTAGMLGIAILFSFVALLVVAAHRVVGRHPKPRVQTRDLRRRIIALVCFSMPLGLVYLPFGASAVTSNARDLPGLYLTLYMMGLILAGAGGVAIWGLLARSTRDYFQAAARIRAEQRVTP